MLKRGISGIITSVLLIVLALAAVAIMWSVLNDSFQRQGEKINNQTQSFINQLINPIETQNFTCSENWECGIDHAVSALDCSIDGDVVADWQIFTCHNPGTQESYCSSMVEEQIAENCEEGCSSGDCLDTQRTGITYYASPTGSINNPGTFASPFTISNFWSVAQPGDILLLRDGEYTGDNNMIIPPEGLSGNSVNKITIRALNDGRANINAEGLRKPVRLTSNNWFVLEGFNAYNSNYHTIALGSNSNNNVIRRVVAWNSGMTGSSFTHGNAAILQISANENNLVVDSAFFGGGPRKTVSFSQGGNNATARRVWARWEGSENTNGAPFQTYAIAYNNYNALLENSIGTWDQVSFPANLEGPGIFASDHFEGSMVSNSKIVGSIAYVKPGQIVPAQLGLYSYAWTDGFTIENSLAISANPITPVPRSFYLAMTNYWDRETSWWVEADIIPNPPHGSYPIHYYTAISVSDLDNDGIFGERGIVSPIWPINGGTVVDNEIVWRDNGLFNLKATNITSIGTYAASFFGWNLTNHFGGPTLAAAYGGQTPFTATNGRANVCYRYVNGTLTTQPLWPWPMEQRIIDATTAAGRPVENVTETIINLLGPIPANCRS